MAAARDLYEQDFLEWTARNAELLRAGQFHEADIEHIAEEIEDMGLSQRHQLRSRLRVLLVHLLKWQFQPERLSSSWISTINTQRAEIEDLLEQAPSLRPALESALPKVYRRAAGLAAIETGLSPGAFPEACPFALDRLLDTAFFPE